ncbi:alpha/beta hydrolase [Metallumcola ferriviriculae]|uniref:Alpha/beta hydrolase n=1 Tax=Metallumcola ferriviriculae TaxID=3039180 RepID=A0AAU0UND9_9FIRM|nr:alpha/beta hydrolase [Desulfitibacteraceae bacterium MK1]
MKEKTFTFHDKEDVEIFVYKWMSDKPIKGIVQVAHGMAETASRYRYFAEELTKQGFLVYANDHRGHGNTAKEHDNLGYCGEDGFNKMVENLYDLNQIISKEQPHCPLFLFGHSMGSFLVQKYIFTYPTDQLAGVILSGSNGKKAPLLLNVAEMIAKRRLKKLGPKHRDEFLNSLMFSDFNKKFRPNKTPFDWLSRNDEEVQKYANNPQCGFVSSTGYFYDLLRALKGLHTYQNMSQIRKELPIYIFSGDKDPVGNFGKGIKNLVSSYHRHGLQDVTYKLYPEGRHEMLNETNKDEVIEDTLAWLRKYCE